MNNTTIEERAREYSKDFTNGKSGYEAYVEQEVVARAYTEGATEQMSITKKETITEFSKRLFDVCHQWGCVVEEDIGEIIKAMEYNNED